MGRCARNLWERARTAPSERTADFELSASDTPIYEYVQQAEKRDREKMKDQELFFHNVLIMIIIEQFGRVFVIAYHP